MDEYDEVLSPSWYTKDRTLQPVDVILDWFPDDYLLGTILKYLSRVGRKNDAVQDLEKMRFYLDKKIDLLKRERNSRAMPLDLTDPDH